MILLATVLSKKSQIISLFFLFVSLGLLFAGPFVLKNYLDKALRQTKVETTLVKKLNFSNTLIVQGNIINLSKRKLSICSLHVDVVRNGKNSLQEFVNKLKPIRKRTMILDRSLDINDSIDFRVVFENFFNEKDFNVSIESSCY
jgi:hypothetical protein